MGLVVYEYAGCDTCRKALKYLDEKKIAYTKKPIVETPPSMAELKKMLDYLKAEGGSFRGLFNTSGVLYREMEIGDKIKAGLKEDEALRLLAKHGKLVKRPFLLADGRGTVGFKKEIWDKIFS